MNKITTLFLVLCLICANTSLVIAEPVLPQFVIPQNETEVRSETSQSNDNIVVIAESDDLLQVIGYSYDMEGNLWWRVIDYRSSKDGYIIATSLDEIDEIEAIERKKQIDMRMSAPIATAIPTPTPTIEPTPIPNSESAKVSSEESTSFLIRNGITYGMTLREVREFENSRNTYCIQERANQLLYRDSVAGIEGTSVIYNVSGIDFALLAKVDMFKDQTFWEDTMNLIVYEFQGLDKSAGGFQRAQEIYYSMKEILIEKYGIPQTNELSYRIPVDNYLLSNAANSGTHIFSEWIVPYSDCYVIVSLICQSNGVCGTTYRLLSYEEYAAIANYYQNKADEIRSDL